MSPPAEAGGDPGSAPPSGPFGEAAPDTTPEADDDADAEEEAPRFEPDPVDATLTDEERTYEEERQRGLRQRGLNRLFRPGAGTTFAAGTGNITAGRDNHFHQNFGQAAAAQQLRPGPLLPQQLERLRRTTVRTNSYAEIISRLPGRHVVLLNGRQGTGRRATALAALDDYIRQNGAAPDAQVELMDEPSGLGNIDTSKMSKGYGYVCDALEGRLPASAVLSSLRKELQDAGAYLVVIGHWTPGHRDDLVNDYTVDHDPPPAAAILRSYLYREFGPERVNQVLNESALAVELTRLIRPADAAEFAAHVVAGLGQDLHVSEILAEWHPTKKIAAAQDEFKTGDRWKRSFLFACAALDGLPAGTVSRVTHFLVSLQNENGDASTAEVSGAAIEEWATCVQTCDAESGAPAGSGRVVRLEHPALGPAILGTAWQRHVGLRDAVLPWLRHLADHENADVRLAAAQIVGKLATYDFDVIRAEILTEWACSGRFNDRQATAWAVEALAQQDRFTGRVRHLIRGWARSGDAARCATAIAVYGTSYGAYHAEEAIEAMRRIAASRALGAKAVEQALARAIGQSMTEMFAAGATKEVVSALEQWARSDAWLLRWAAARSLTRLARQNGERPGWPTLLSLIDNQPALRKPVTVLWQNALVEGPTTEISWNALRYWLESDKRVREEDAGHVRELLRGLLSLLAEDPKVHDRLRFHIALWEFRSRSRVLSMPDALRQKRK